MKNKNGGNIVKEVMRESLMDILRDAEALHAAMAVFQTFPTFTKVFRTLMMLSLWNDRQRKLLCEGLDLAEYFEL